MMTHYHRLMRAAAMAIFLLLLFVSDLACAAPPPNRSQCNKALAITNTQSLRFGDILAAGVGTVTISPAGSRTSTGGAIAAGGVTSPAVFAVSAMAGCDVLSYSLLLPANITLNSGANTMTVGTFTSALSVSTLVNASGSGQASVGATLQVGSGQTAGNYAGQFMIEIVFQ